MEINYLSYMSVVRKGETGAIALRGTRQPMSNNINGEIISLNNINKSENIQILDLIYQKL